MIEFKTREQRKKELLDQAEELLATVDEDAIHRAQERRYLGETENDNKLKQYADQEHVKRLLRAMEQAMEADDENK